jgi:Iap family predicted aminopeptidase
MKKSPLIIAMSLLVTFVNAQDINKLITEDYVKTVVSTLASDDMKGRNARKPESAFMAADYIASLFKETGLDYLNDLQSYKQEFDTKGIKMTNVVGMIKGKSKPEEFVVFSAHYDHIGIQTEAVAGDSIANGADDDASGTTAVIALAKYFKALNNNERTLIFVTFTAEEIGGFGSKYFTEHVNSDKVVAMFNIEMIGKHSKWGTKSVFITGFERSNFGSILQKNVKGSEFRFEPDPYPEQDLFYRSDNARLAMKGVPAHSLSTDMIDTDKFYHSVDDEVETLDIKNMTDVIKAIAMGSKSIVNGKDTPTRIPPLEKGK